MPVTYRAPAKRLLATGPWRGARAVQPGPGVDAEQYLYSTANGVLDNTGGYLVRPGFKRINSSALSGAIQLHYTFRKTDGTVLLVAISGGQIYIYTAGAYSLQVTTANFGTASVTRSTTARMYAVTLANKMVIHDGTNKPFTWDGTSGASGIAELTNADVWYGQHTVYYAKVAAIKNSDRLTFEWSEENDPTTGYEAGGFSNSWTLGQTSSEPLVGLLGTNEALYYWRTTSMGAIRGAMNADFVTTGTQDAFPGAPGLAVSHARAAVGGAIWWVDHEGKAQRLVGGERDPIWQQLSDLYPPVGTASGAAAIFGSGWTPSYTAITRLPSLGLVLISYAISGTTPAFEHFAFQENGNWTSDWLHAGSLSFNVVGEWFDATSKLTFVVMTTANGYSFQLGLPGYAYDEAENGTAVAIPLQVNTHRLGWTEQVEQQFTRLDVVVNTMGAPATVGVVPAVKTSRQAEQSLTSQTTVTTSELVERHLVWGLRRNGRWLSTTVAVTPSATNGTKPYGVRQIGVTGVPVSTHPVLT